MRGASLGPLRAIGHACMERARRAKKTGGLPHVRACLDARSRARVGRRARAQCGAGDDEKIEAITKLLCATHKCDAKVFNAELIKLVGSQGAQLRAKQRARRPASMPERHHHCPAPLAPSR